MREDCIKVGATESGCVGENCERQRLPKRSVRDRADCKELNAVRHGVSGRTAEGERCQKATPCESATESGRCQSDCLQECSK